MYEDPLDLGDRVHLARKPVPWVMKTVMRNEEGLWRNKGVRMSCQAAVQGRSFDLRQKEEKKLRIL